MPPLTIQPLSQTHTILPTTKGLSGTFVSWREALAPKPPAHPTLSSSTSRAPGSIQNFVRGKGSYAPFAPGGLETAAKPDEDDEEEEVDDEGGWKSRAPGLKRGLKLDGGMSTLRRSSAADKRFAADEFLAEMLGEQSIASKARRKRRDGEETASLEISRLGDGEDKDGIPEGGSVGMSKKNVDDLLPVGVSVKFGVHAGQVIDQIRLAAITGTPSRSQAVQVSSA
jgi:antiviral helicase SKI2